MRSGESPIRVALCALLLVAAGPPTWAEPSVIQLVIRDGTLPKDLHGYDLEQKLLPGASVSMRFPARATGRFAIEVHAHGSGGERTLGYLEVHPR